MSGAGFSVHFASGRRKASPHNPALGHTNATKRYLLKTDKQTNKFLSLFKSPRIWQELLPAFSVGCEQSHNIVPQRAGAQLLGGRWLHRAISHTLNYSILASSNFQIQAKQSPKLLRNIFFLPTHRCLYVHTRTRDNIA